MPLDAIFGLIAAAAGAAGAVLGQVIRSIAVFFSRIHIVYEPF